MHIKVYQLLLLLDAERVSQDVSCYDPFMHQGTCKIYFTLLRGKNPETHTHIYVLACVITETKITLQLYSLVKSQRAGDYLGRAVIGQGTSFHNLPKLYCHYYHRQSSLDNQFLFQYFLLLINTY